MSEPQQNSNINNDTPVTQELSSIPTWLQWVLVVIAIIVVFIVGFAYAAAKRRAGSPF